MHIFCMAHAQLSRDEHLLLAVVAVMALDLAVLLPWQLVDPITCRTWTTASSAAEVFSQVSVIHVS